MSKQGKEREGENWILTDEEFHVEDPVEGVDLGEGGDVDGEAAVWKYNAKHLFPPLYFPFPFPFPFPISFSYFLVISFLR